MPFEINTQPFHVDLYGYSEKILNKDYAGTGRSLTDALWKEVKSKGIKNKGVNHSVYDKDDMLFAGVELDQDIPTGSTLELKEINLSRYACWKHIGPYSKLKDAYDGMNNELAKRGLRSYFPFLEIYGHWTHDETKLETEVIFSLTPQN